MVRMVVAIVNLYYLGLLTNIFRLLPFISQGVSCLYLVIDSMTSFYGPVIKSHIWLQLSGNIRIKSYSYPTISGKKSAIISESSPTAKNCLISGPNAIRVRPMLITGTKWRLSVSYCRTWPLWFVVDPDSYEKCSVMVINMRVISGTTRNAV